MKVRRIVDIMHGKWNRHRQPLLRSLVPSGQQPTSHHIGPNSRRASTTSNRIDPYPVQANHFGTGKGPREKGDT